MKSGAPIAITGLGAISACGPDLASLAAALRTGRDGLARASLAELPLAARFPIGRVDQDLGAGPRGEALAQRAAVAALAMAGLDPREAGLSVGSCTGGMRGSEARYLAGGPQGFASIYTQQPVGRQSQALARRLGCRGPVTSHAEACASAAVALIEAVEWLRSGLCPAVIVIGVDPLTRVTMSGFYSLQIIDEQGCRPFTAERAGMSLGEGAAALVLESAAQARARGARPLASLLGWGLQADAHHLTAPEPSGRWLSQAITTALTDAGVGPEAVDFTVAHGTGTQDNDACEAAVLGRLLPHAPVASLKRTLGHTMGASAAFNAIGACLAVGSGDLCVTAGAGSAMPGLDVVRTPRRQRTQVALATCLAFGGVNTALLIGEGSRCS